MDNGQRLDYEHDMADRVVAAAGTIRHATAECAAIEARAEKAAGTTKAFSFRKDADWRFWNNQRAGAANEIVCLVRGMGNTGLPVGASELGGRLRELYREMCRNARAGREPAPRTYVPNDWIAGMELPEILALAPRMWKDYLNAHRVAQ